MSTPIERCSPKQRGRQHRPKIKNVQWQQLRAEDLPAGLGSFRVISFAQSFHWMDQPRVARDRAQHVGR